jgi:N-acetylmuramoyl-L-alanine amidase CwlA
VFIVAYTFKTKIANKNNYGGLRDTSAIKYIVIHYTANDGDTDENNGKYFADNIIKASAHYFVDDDSVTQSVPDNYIAWSVGGCKYSNCDKIGGGKYYKKATNSNTLNIEICDDIKNGVVYPSVKTINNVLELTKSKMKKYNIPAKNVIRHFDVNGKICPAYWCGTTKNDAKWKSEFWNKLSTPLAHKKSLDDWAKEVVAGKHGNGHTNREKSLKKSGCEYSYVKVRARVNELLK